MSEQRPAEISSFISEFLQASAINWMSNNAPAVTVTLGSHSKLDFVEGLTLTELRATFNEHATPDERSKFAELKALKGNRRALLHSAFGNDATVDMYTKLKTLADSDVWNNANENEKYALASEFIEREFEGYEQVALRDGMGAMALRALVNDLGKIEHGYWKLEQGEPVDTRMKPGVLSGEALQTALDKGVRRHHALQDLAERQAMADGVEPGSNATLPTRRSSNLRTGRYVPTAGIMKKDFE